MADALLRYRSSFTAQASAAITIDSFSTGTQTDFDTTTSGNADGCSIFEIEIDITVAPSATAYAQIWCEALQHDGTGYTEAYSVGISDEIAASTTGKFRVALLNLPEKGRLKIKALDSGFTASISVAGKYLSTV